MSSGLKQLPEQRQQFISVGLIALNIILALLYAFCTPQTEDSFFMAWLAVGIFAVVLQAIFVFSHKGRAPLLSKWLLFLFFVITAGYGLLIAYTVALGKAFQH
ncbi:MAG: hypothetical protein EOO13_07010 [Chitinophagaceae bacterium]|nr:MAG: hypothetical protein EOO13_07010 [Chitinophagaceae bacterium]